MTYFWVLSLLLLGSVLQAANSQKASDEVTEKLGTGFNNETFNEIINLVNPKSKHLLSDYQELLKELKLVADVTGNNAYWKALERWMKLQHPQLNLDDPVERFFFFYAITITTCTNDTNCASTQYCHQGLFFKTCQAKKCIGLCFSNNMCTSNVCSNFFCQPCTTTVTVTSVIVSWFFIFPFFIFGK